MNKLLKITIVTILVTTVTFAVFEFSTKYQIAEKIESHSFKSKSYDYWESQALKTPESKAFFLKYPNSNIELMAIQKNHIELVQVDYDPQTKIQSLLYITFFSDFDKPEIELVCLSPTDNFDADEGTVGLILASNCEELLYNKYNPELIQNIKYKLPDQKKTTDFYLNHTMNSSYFKKFNTNYPDSSLFVEWLSDDAITIVAEKQVGDDKKAIMYFDYKLGELFTSNVEFYCVDGKVTDILLATDGVTKYNVNNFELIQCGN